MSLYNMMCGVNPGAGFLLNLIGVDKNEIPRPRDVYLDEDEQHVIIYTRTGGGNREEYQAENDALTRKPNYVDNWDDNFDCTFAHFKFKIPQDEQRKLIEEFAELSDEEKKKVMDHIKITPGAKFQEVLEALRSTDIN